MRPTTFVAALAIAVALCGGAYAASTVSTLSYKAELRMHPFSTLPQAPFAWIDGATVNIEFGYVRGNDKLLFDYSGQFNITASFNDVNGVLYLSGLATASEYTNAVASVVFFTTSRNGGRRQLTYSFGKDTFFFSLTEHYYRLNSYPGLTWADAAQRCAASTFFGISGYLATINSADEQMELSAIATYDAWLGGNDKAKWGEYRWAAGPDGNLTTGAGPLFWTGMSQYVGGAAPENTFSAWNRFQPENPQGSGKDYVYLVNSADQDTAYWGVAGDGDLVAGFVCEYGSPETTLTDARMGGSIELVHACSLFSTPATCNAESATGCSWEESTNACVQSTCSKYTAQSNCEADSGCNWNVEGPIGVCVSTACGSLAADVCATNPQCIVDSTGVNCRNAVCSDRATACSCNSQAGCSWREGVCGNEQTLDCDGEDVVFVIDGSSLMKDTFGRYPNAFYGLTDALIDTQFLFNGAKAGTQYTSLRFGQRVGVLAFGPTNMIPGGSGRLTSNRDEFVSDVQWLQTGFAPVGAGRSIRSALQAAANMFDGAPNRTRTVVVIAAGAISDAAAIASSYRNNAQTGNVLGLLRSLGVKVIGAALSASSSRTEESVAAAASLQDLTESAVAVIPSTIRQLQDYVFYGMCDGTALSRYIQPATAVSHRCSSITATDMCNSNHLCAWNPASQECQNNMCLSYCTAAQCDTNLACSFSDSLGICSGACAQLTQDTACDAVPACFWDYRIGDAGKCVDKPCLVNPNEDACIAESGCEWNPRNATPCGPTPCSTSDPSACAAEEGCIFTGSECVQDPCREMTDAAACRGFAQCEWKSGTCQRNACGMRQTETECVATDECLWNMTLAPAACGPAPCTSLNANPTTAQILCGQDSRCTWSTAGPAPRCIVNECELLTDSCSCNRQASCLWRNNSCTQNAFAQCPATDVVFLVEATPVMMEAFGRHPNGVVGVVEAIRSWSSEAPFSHTPDAAGFRFSMIMYGQTRKAFAVPSDVGGGGNLTSTRDQWLGANQEISWLLQNYQTYAGNGAAGSAALRPALAKAITAFQNAGAPQRKRLLVVIGNSPITDGGSEMLREISALEAMKVNVFANVARRFSYITPVDLRAANFMRPIASDPPSVYFSFTTIDTMQDTLLENFCDPSSATGKVLDVSRDGELPCEWLEGQEECNLQGGCMWDAQATKTCPVAGQCPSLNCQTLPSNLANLFDCSHCTLRSGAISCSRASPPAEKRGLCKKSTCATKCQSDCSSGCEWVAANRCERDMCAVHNSDMMGCIANPGCVYKMNDGGSPYCAKSICGRMRDQTACATYMVDYQGSNYEPCFVNTTTTPPICQQKACGELNDATCQAAPMSGDGQGKGPCTFVSSQRPKCRQKTCQYASAELCEFDANCYWNPFEERCNPRLSQCVLSPYSDWSPCSATCGAAVTYKSRAVMQFASGGATCASVASKGCSSEYPHLCAPSDKNMTIIQSCTQPPAATGGVWIPTFPSLPSGEWPMDCARHCSDHPDRNACIMDSACRWKGSACQVKPFLGCQSLTAAQCATSDMCTYDSLYSLCRPSVDVCQYLTQSQCNTISPCSWRTGSSALSLAGSAGVPLQLFNPGQEEIYPFDTLEAASTQVIYGATVTIEGNYQRGKDVLQSTYTQLVRGTWIESAGTLKLTGRAPVSEYLKTIRFVTFTTTSTRTVPRTVTWSLGNDTAYSSATSHHYRAFENVGATYTFAESACSRQTLYGLRGYLATITSEAENDIVATKLFADGWLSGSDAQGKTWVMTSGPENQVPFWTGPASSLGGQAVKGAFTNWSPPNNTNLYGEPIINTGVGGTTGNDRVYLSRSGYWESRVSDTTNSNGYVCEFGGMTDDVAAAFPRGGSMIIGIGGCVAQTCVWHRTQADCELDIECGWNNGVCEAGCGARSTEAECGQSTRCRWDSSVLPPICDVDPCGGLAQAACPRDTRCQWDHNNGCTMRKGCAAFQETDCVKYDTCMWNGASCIERGCGTFDSISECRNVPRCRWDDDSTTCVDQYCQFPSEQLCATDSDRCLWNNPTDSNSIQFSPNQGSIVPFRGVAPNRDSSTVVDGFVVAITGGFQPNMDKLSLTVPADDAMNYQWTYDGTKGVLRCNVAADVTIVASDVWLFMSQAVRFSTTSGSTDPRRITYAMSANTVYSARTGLYFKWFANAAPTTFAEAQAYCAARPLFDMAGTLAAVRDEIDQQRLRQAGAAGWLAASSDAQGQFRWSLPNGASQLFWNGTGLLSQPVMDPTAPANATQYLFAQWDLNQPSAPSTYVYAEATGYWKSIANVANKKGVICMYNGLNSQYDVGVTRIAEPAGCFIGQCKPLTMLQCGNNPQCRWDNGICARDVRCAPGRSLSACRQLAGCYWDYDVSMCIAATPSECSVHSTSDGCAGDGLCRWDPSLLNVEQGTSGFCTVAGCGSHPAQSPCLADPRCKWSAGACTERLCGYSTSRECWRDSSCMWEATATYEMCVPSPCIQHTDQSNCDAADSCGWDATRGRCQYRRCTTQQGLQTCLADKGCLFKGGACMLPACYPNMTAATCNALDDCFFFVGTKSCGAAQCTSYGNQGDCEAGQNVTALKPCIWDAGKCRQLTYAEQNAPSVLNDCEKQVNPNMWWLWLFLAIILVLLGMILHRLYLAHAGNLNFFEPTRKNYKYNPHERYATAIVDHARDRDEDTNLL